jgi:hypothetical protein
MTKMAVRAARIVVRALMVPVTDHTRSKHKYRNQREGNSENAKSLLHRPVNRSMIRNETEAEATA